MRKKLTLADIEELQFILKTFIEYYKMSRVPTLKHKASRLKGTLIKAEMEYFKKRESK